MLSLLDKILSTFSKCFSRQKPFLYFILVIVSFMLLTDDSGVTSFIRILFLDPKTYDGLLHFFNSNAYDLDEIAGRWANTVLSSPQAYVVNGRNVLVGDHTKVSKEGRRMPGMKSHHQESDDFGKPDTIFGFHFGALGVLVGNVKQLFCSPLQLKVHEGAEQLDVWEGKEPQSRKVRLVAEALSRVDKMLQSFYLLLDRDFMTVKGVKAVQDHNASSENRLDLVGRCKKSVACQRKLTEEEKAANRKLKKRGRPKEYTDKVRPWDWFETHENDFRKVTLEDGSTVRVYGQVKHWNDMPLLFVLSEQDGKKALFYSTDLELSPKQVVELYKLRFKIEVSFKELKHVVHGFDFHFWAKDFEKLTKHSKDRLKRVPAKDRPRIKKCVRRIERSVNFAGMALGVLQLMALEVGMEVSPREIRYQRTYRHEDQLSVEQMQALFSGIFSFLCMNNPENEIVKTVRLFMNDDLASKTAA